MSHRSPTPFSLWVEMLYIDHTLSHSPSPLVQVLPLWNHCSYLQMGTTQRASENFPSKIFPAEKAVPAQEKFNAFHVHWTFQPGKSFHIHFFRNILTHLPAHSWLGALGMRGRKTIRNPERENRREFRGTSWVWGLACEKGTIPTHLSPSPGPPSHSRWLLTF